MQLQERSVEDWSAVIGDLTNKKQAAHEHLEQLRAQKRDLALEASLGSTDARKALKQINEKLSLLALEGDDWDAALAQAQSQKQQAEQAEAANAERERQEQITVNLEQYVAEVRKIDALMQELATRFGAARRALEFAEEKMDAMERRPVQQLKTTFGPTAAAAYFGLGNFLSLGSESSYPQHRKPLAQFVSGFVDRWVAKSESTD